MNFTLPNSLVANIHLPDVRVELFLRFHKDGEGEKDLSIAAKILEQASDLDPELQELLAKFGEYLQRQRAKEEGQHG